MSSKSVSDGIVNQISGIENVIQDAGPRGRNRDAINEAHCGAETRATPKLTHKGRSVDGCNVPCHQKEIGGDIYGEDSNRPKQYRSFIAHSVY